MPIGPGDMPKIPIPEVHYAGKTEIILGDHWTAEYVESDELPDDAPLLYGYAAVVRGDYGYVTEPDDGDGWRVVEGDFREGESADDFVSRAAMQQTGATVSQTLLCGYLDCRATSYNEEHETHFRAIRPLYIAIASEVGRTPEGSGFHRRRLPMNKFQNELRRVYPALAKHFMPGIGKYLVMERSGQLG